MQTTKILKASKLEMDFVKLIFQLFMKGQQHFMKQYKLGIHTFQWNHLNFYLLLKHEVTILRWPGVGRGQLRPVTAYVTGYS